MEQVLAPGTIVGGKYQLGRVLGSGGMGVVFAARHLGLGQPVAVKILRRDHVEDPRAASRLVREARIVATLRSEHVAKVHDVGTQDGAPFLVMELLEGRTVYEVVAVEGALSIPRAADIAIQACHALGDAHARGTVHRDVKPSNLFLVGGGFAGEGETLKVIDFGISKARPLGIERSGSETTTGTMLGSPSFMSPEQIRSSSDVDARSDVWSLGVVLHFMLAGEKPFEAESLLDLMTLIVHEPSPSLLKKRADMPEQLVAVVQRCLEKDPGRRFSTMADLARALAPFASPRMRALALTVPIAEPTGVRIEGDSTPSGPAVDEHPTTDMRTPASAPMITTATMPLRSERVVTLRSEASSRARLGAWGAAVAFALVAAVAFAFTRVTAPRARANAPTITAPVDAPPTSTAASSDPTLQAVATPVVSVQPAPPPAVRASASPAPAAPWRASTSRPRVRTPKVPTPDSSKSARPDLPSTPD